MPKQSERNRPRFAAARASRVQLNRLYVSGGLNRIDDTGTVVTKQKRKKTEGSITGRFG